MERDTCGLKHRFRRRANPFACVPRRTVMYLARLTPLLLVLLAAALLLTACGKGGGGY
jgi:hypothetical protein